MTDKRLIAEVVEYKSTLGEAKKPETSVPDVPYKMKPGVLPAELVPATRKLACKRIKVKKILSLIPIKYLEALEHNQNISSCCRHPEEHDLEAWYSKPEEKAPDIYIFHCRCGRQHRRFCIGGGDERPFWEVT